MNIEEKVKLNLLARGFDEDRQLNNRGLIGATIDETIIEVVKNLNIPVVSGSLLPTTLMRLHPELTYSEAESLMEFAKSKTITHEECYGDGSIIYPMWKEANCR